MSVFSLVLVFLLVAAVVCLAVYIRRNPYDEIPVKKGGENCEDDCTTCMDVCASSKISAAQMAAQKYFDDEELDALAGIKGEDYSDEQTELFRNVLESLQPDEVVEWTESLRRREIELPVSLKDEVVMMINGN